MTQFDFMGGDWRGSLIVLIILFLIFLGVMIWIRIPGCSDKLRIRWALKFGKLEHRFGRLIGLMSLFTIIAINYSKYSIYFAISTFICWVIYLCSHKIEKKLYPRNFRF